MCNKCGVETARNKKGECVNCVKSYNKAYYEANKDNIKSVQKAYRQSPKGKAKRNASRAKRRATKLNANPSWSNEDHIKMWYEQAKHWEWLTGEPYHVDHVVPLQGKNVSGLHVAHNLEVIPARLDLAKSNIHC